jgi:hypothetical protein
VYGLCRVETLETSVVKKIAKNTLYELDIYEYIWNMTKLKSDRARNVYCSVTIHKFNIAVHPAIIDLEGEESKGQPCVHIVH